MGLRVWLEVSTFYKSKFLMMLFYVTKLWNLVLFACWLPTLSNQRYQNTICFSLTKPCLGSMQESFLKILVLSFVQSDDELSLLHTMLELRTWYSWEDNSPLVNNILYAYQHHPPHYFMFFSFVLQNTWDNTWFLEQKDSIWKLWNTVRLFSLSVFGVSLCVRCT